MRKIYIALVVVPILAAAVFFALRNGGSEPGKGPMPPTGGPRTSAGPPMTVELVTVSRAPINEHVVVVGNLIGATTVDVVPKISGRLQSVAVRIGDRVRPGQMIAKVEDQEIREQVKQVQASHDVSSATIRQREADLNLAEINLERSRSLFDRRLLSKQALDEVVAGHQAAVAQLDLARAQFDQAKARLEELQINLANTVIVSPVDGFVGKRNLDPGAYVSSNTPVASVVDIHFVRLVANLVEKDLRRISVGMPAEVEVDAYPGERFEGRLARVAPVLDPATRTAEMEVEVPNAGFRLKPGMYARVRITVDQREAALVVPRNALVDIEGRRGVFVAQSGAPETRKGGASNPPDRDGPASAPLTVQFRPVETGLAEQEWVEIVQGVGEGERVVTTGAGALNNGDRIRAAGPEPVQRRGPT
jgi:HlyD family secretion protein